MQLAEFRAMSPPLTDARPTLVDTPRGIFTASGIWFNTTEQAQSYRDSYSIRRTALTQAIPYYTTLAGARAAAQAIRRLKTGELQVRALQTYA